MANSVSIVGSTADDDVGASTGGGVAVAAGVTVLFMEDKGVAVDTLGLSGDFAGTDRGTIAGGEMTPGTGEMGNPALSILLTLAATGVDTCMGGVMEQWLFLTADESPVGTGVHGDVDCWGCAVGDRASAAAAASNRCCCSYSFSLSSSSSFCRSCSSSFRLLDSSFLFRSSSFLCLRSSSCCRLRSSC